LDREIDVERARRALQRALERLRNFQDPTIDRERAQQARDRAMARLKAAGAM
jgi:ATP synthase F1 subcomplex epsilon subunit